MANICRIIYFIAAVTTISLCQTGFYEIPKNCNGDSCQYRAAWTYIPASDSVEFTVRARVGHGKWAGIGFSDDNQMINSDAVVGWVAENEDSLTLTDRYLFAKAPNQVPVDGEENVTPLSHSLSNGFLTYSFSRKRDTGDLFDRSLKKCGYLLFAWGGTGMSSNAITVHTNQIASEDTICIGPAQMQMFSTSQPTADSSTTMLTSSQSPSQATSETMATVSAAESSALGVSTRSVLICEVCPANSECLTNDGWYMCVCKTGYNEDGVKCTRATGAEMPTTTTSQSTPKTDATTQPKSQPTAESGTIISAVASIEPDVGPRSLSDCGTCIANSECVKTKAGSYKCRCKSGYKRKNRKCMKTTEDAKTDSPAETPTISSPAPPTAATMSATSEPTSSEPSPERKTPMSASALMPLGVRSRSRAICQNCPPNSHCVTRAGLFKCTCNVGYREDEGKCTSTVASAASVPATPLSTVEVTTVSAGLMSTAVEVERSLGGCSSCPLHSTCVEISNTYECLCKPGYRMDEGKCKAHDPCRGVQCDEHASCRMGKCQCKNGYFVRNNKCIEYKSPCHGLKCGPHGHCKMLSGHPKCHCTSGYRMYSRSCVRITTNPCHDMDCGPHGRCMNTYGKATCHCKSGYHSTSGHCKLVQQHSCGGKNCGLHGFCRDWNGKKQCACKGGYFMANGQCKSIALMDNFGGCHSQTSCGKFGYCDHDRKCKCQTGYVMKNGNCIPPHTSDHSGYCQHSCGKHLPEKHCSCAPSCKYLGKCCHDYKAYCGNLGFHGGKHWK